MRLLTQRTVVLGVLAFSVLSFECVGTPMPIPPSVTGFDEERLAVVVEEEGCDGLLEDDCLVVSGAAGSTEPFATVYMHALVVEDYMELGLMDTVSDASGAFELTFVGPSNGIFRAIVHGSESSRAVNLRAETGGEEPWSVITVDDSDTGQCLEFTIDVLDFGELRVGSTSTQIVDITNICEEPMEAFGAYIDLFFEAVEGDFGAMAPMDELAPGESTGLVVAFWPEEVRDHFGVLIVDMVANEGMGSVRMSLPVRGRAIAR